ncbi:hypothetical protein ACTPEF_24840, partial [Clostridioides difficile]
CPASCGEFVQGIIDDEEYLCSYAIDMYSKVYIEEKLVDINLGTVKSLVLLGETASNIENCAKNKGFNDIHIVKDMEEAVKTSYEI